MASAVAGSAISGIAYKDMPREKVYLVVIFAVIQVMENLDCISIFFLILIFFISVGCHVRVKEWDTNMEFHNNVFHYTV